MEIVIFDELIQVYAEHLKGYTLYLGETNKGYHMIPKSEIVPDAHHIPLVILIIISKHFKDFDFNLALLVEFLLILEYFHGDLFLLWMSMVDAAQYDSKGPSSQLLNNLIPIVDLIR